MSRGWFSREIGIYRPVWPVFVPENRRKDKNMKTGNCLKANFSIRDRVSRGNSARFSEYLAFEYIASSY